MANQFINFTYNPTRDGFNLNTWRQFIGDPTIVPGPTGDWLSLDAAAIIHYGDILRCDVSFGVNMAGPVAGDDRTIGLVLYNKNCYAYFKVVGDVFSAETSDGTNTNSVVIDWDPLWSAADIVLRVKWEAGTVTFFVNGVQQAAINDVSVTGDPMSLYLTSDASGALLVKYIIVKSVQSFVMSQGNSNSVFALNVKEHDHLRLTEVVTVRHAAAMAVSVNSGINLSENFSKTLPLIGINKSDTINISEDTTMFTDLYHQSVSDSLDITEEVTIQKDELDILPVNDPINISEETTISEPA